MDSAALDTFRFSTAHGRSLKAHPSPSSSPGRAADQAWPLLGFCWPAAGNHLQQKHRGLGANPASCSTLDRLRQETKKLEKPADSALAGSPTPYGNLQPHKPTCAAWAPLLQPSTAQQPSASWLPAGEGSPVAPASGGPWAVPVGL